MTLPLVRSRLFPLGFVHGFTERAGGVSPPPYDTMNVGFKWGDDTANVIANRALVHTACGASRLLLAKQVHGSAVAVVSMDDDVDRVAALQADAVVTADEDLGVGVIVADCVPVLLADPVTGACAAIHAGWRGTAANVVGETVATLTRRFGVRPADLVAAIGPSIGPCCFEVGDEVVAALTAVLPGHAGLAAIGPRGRAHADLWRANAWLLQSAGVGAGHIDVLGECTHCQPHRFFSYRRDGSVTGQMMAFVARRSVAP
ncbi:MAG: peptidoglycan editing factor PgeF [Deltaproteobacteria bacterium]|nr:peptidoglycan editing factor PgeF [Deltaproteobacteria bacterium]